MCNSCTAAGDRAVFCHICVSRDKDKDHKMSCKNRGLGTAMRRVLVLPGAGGAEGSFNCNVCSISK